MTDADLMEIAYLLLATIEEAASTEREASVEFDSPSGIVEIRIKVKTGAPKGTLVN